MNQKINNAPGQSKIEIPEAREAIDKMKYEIAKELGIEVPKRGNAYDWRMVPSYHAGLIGGEIVKRSMQLLERMVASNPETVANVLASTEKGERIAQEQHPDLTPYEKGPKDLQH